MSKISIAEQFALDAINAPALVTGGGKSCKGSKKKSRKNTKKYSKKSSKKSGSRGNGCAPCWVPPPTPCKY